MLDQMGECNLKLNHRAFPVQRKGKKMDTVEIKNVKSIVIEQPIETIDRAFRSIIIQTDTGSVEIVLTAQDPDALKVAM